MTEADPSLSRRKWLVGALSVGAMATTALFRPTQTAPRLKDGYFDALWPKQFGDWRYLSSSGLVLPPSDQLSRDLYQQLLTRVYEGPNSTAVMLLIAYSNIQEGNISIHRPEVCYPAGGYRLTSNQEHDLRLVNGVDIPSRLIVAEQAARSETMVYWTRVGSAMPRRWLDQRLYLASENIKGRIPDGLLARASMIGSDAAAGAVVLDGFVRAFVAALTPVGRRLLVG